MKNKYRIIETNGLFYPQYYKNSWWSPLDGWRNFTRRVPPMSMDIWFKTLKEAEDFIKHRIGLNQPKEIIIHLFDETENP